MTTARPRSSVKSRPSDSIAPTTAVIVKIEGVHHCKRVATCATVILDEGGDSQMLELQSSNVVRIAEHSQTRGTD